MGIKYEKSFIIIFFMYILILSATFLAYDYIGEELKRLIIMTNVIILLLIIAMMIYAKIFFKRS